MKKLFFMLFTLVVAAAAMSQPTPMHRGHGKPGQGPGMQNINMTESQKAEMKKLNESFRQKMQDLNKKESITVKQQRDQREALMNAHRKDMEKILTPEQKQQLAKNRDEHHAQQKEMMEKRIDDAKSKFGLSEQQVTSLKSLNGKTMAQMKALHENQSLDRIARRDQMASIMEAHKTEMSKILTKDQLQQWKEMQPPHMMKGGGGPGRGPGPGGHKGFES